MTTPFQIDVSRIDLASVVQLMDSEQLSGHLTVAELGYIAFRQGEAVGASCRELTGVDGALTIMMEAAGLCELVDVDTPQGPALMSTMALLIDAARLADDWHALAPRVLAAVDGRAIPDVARAVVEHLNGDRTVDEAVRAAGVERVVVLDALLDAVRDGALRDVADPRPDSVQKLAHVPSAPVTFAPAQPSPEQRARRVDPGLSFYDLLDGSRNAVRSRDYELAIEYLEAADGQRPGDRTVAQNLRRLRQLVSTRS